MYEPETLPVAGSETITPSALTTLNWYELTPATSPQVKLTLSPTNGGTDALFMVMFRHIGGATLGLGLTFGVGLGEGLGDGLGDGLILGVGLGEGLGVGDGVGTGFAQASAVMRSVFSTVAL